jgi:hypothetical protein
MQRGAVCQFAQELMWRVMVTVGLVGNRWRLVRLVLVVVVKIKAWSKAGRCWSWAYLSTHGGGEW